MASSEIESLSDFKSTPRGKQERWKSEIDASKKLLEDFQKKATKTVERYVDKRKSEGDIDVRLNLYWSNTTTLKSMLFGNLPKIEVSRQHQDSNDDVARVASEIMERLLTLDVEENGAEYMSVLKSCTEDRLIPGLACARVRYEVETEDKEYEAIKLQDGTEMAPSFTKTQVTYEDAEVDYIFWKDVLWSWTRNWSDLRWVAFCNYFTRDEAEKRFGKDKAKDMTYKTMNISGDKKNTDDDSDVWKKTEIWEIWNRPEGKVVYYTEDVNEILEEKDDPLKLKGFFPCPPFLIANATTSSMIPVPDFCMAQDLYNKIDELQERLSILTDAVKVVGAYDKANEGLDRILTEGAENKLVPVDNWAMFAEKGGFKGAIDWLPIEQVVNAIEKMREYRDDCIALLNMIVGMADVMRGQTQQATGRTPLGETELAAKFGSIRVQSLQEELARFATDLMQLKCEIISRHFEPANIIKLSNIKYSLDSPMADLINQAIALIKNPDEFYIRVIIRPESVAMIDYAQLQQERSAYIQAISLFLQSSAPLIEQAPQAAPVLMELLKWGLAGFKGSNEIEGVLDRAIDQMKMANAQGQNQKPDPEQVKAQGAMQLAGMKQQGEMQKIAAQHQNEMQMQQMEFQNSMREMITKMQGDLAIIMAKFKADMAIEQTQGASDVIATVTQAKADMITRQHEVGAKKDEAKIPTGSENT